MKIENKKNIYSQYKYKNCKTHIRGEVFALLAAMSNSTIGVLNKFCFINDTFYIKIAFYKCAGALFVLSFFLLRKNMIFTVFSNKNLVKKIAFASFFGIFILYFFETWSFFLSPVPLVSFLTYATGIVTIILGFTILKEKITAFKIISIVSIFSGIFFIFYSLNDLKQLVFGACLSIIGGLGYSLYLFFWKKFSIPSNASTLFLFFFFGTIYLSIPFFIQTNGNFSLHYNELIPLSLLIFIPTLCGYYFTSKALNNSESGIVQLIETSDPIFASLLAFIIFGETLTSLGWMGSALIFFGLIILIAPDLICLYKEKKSTTLGSSGQ